MDNEYREAIAQAKANLKEVRERGVEALGRPWSEVRKEFFTPEELAASNLRVQLMTELAHTRHDKGISQRQLEEIRY